MSKKNLLIGAGVLAALVGTAIYAQNSSVKTQEQPQNSVLAEQTQIDQCLSNAFRLITLPEEIILEEEGRTYRVYESDTITAKIAAFKDGYRADDPTRETDQINLFVNFEDRSETPSLLIYRSKQVSFNVNEAIPYAPNENGHPLYDHRNEIETGRNFKPTEKEAEIEGWVDDSIEAMDHEFQTCMGFKDAEDDVSLPTFPEL